MLFDLLYYTTILVVSFAIGLFLFFQSTNPRSTKNGKITTILYDRPPSALDFYLRVIFAKNNLVKPGFLQEGKKLPSIEVICKDATVPIAELKR